MILIMIVGGYAGLIGLVSNLHAFGVCGKHVSSLPTAVCAEQ